MAARRRRRLRLLRWPPITAIVRVRRSAQAPETDAGEAHDFFVRKVRADRGEPMFVEPFRGRRVEGTPGRSEPLGTAKESAVLGPTASPGRQSGRAGRCAAKASRHPSRGSRRSPLTASPAQNLDRCKAEKSRKAGPAADRPLWSRRRVPIGRGRRVVREDCPGRGVRLMEVGWAELDEPVGRRAAVFTRGTSFSGRFLVPFLPCGGRAGEVKKAGAPALRSRGRLAARIFGIGNADQ